MRAIGQWRLKPTNANLAIGLYFYVYYYCTQIMTKNATHTHKIEKKFAQARLPVLFVHNGFQLLGSCDPDPTRDLLPDHGDSIPAEPRFTTITEFQKMPLTRPTAQYCQFIFIFRQNIAVQQINSKYVKQTNASNRKLYTKSQK